MVVRWVHNPKVVGSSPAPAAWSQTAINITGGSVGGSTKKMVAPFYPFLDEVDSSEESRPVFVEGEDSWNRYIHSSLSPVWRELVLTGKASITWISPEGLEDYGLQATGETGSIYFLLHAPEDDKTAVMALSRGSE